jgi:type IV/VI secretion system ImpK/VasF family protein
MGDSMILEAHDKKRFSCQVSPKLNIFIYHALPIISEVLSLPENICDILSRQHDLSCKIEHYQKVIISRRKSNALMHTASYMLCAFVDEWILHRMQQKDSKALISLLHQFYEDSCGGEHFFEKLKDIRCSGTDKIELMELAYWLVNLGYQGKYFNDHTTLDQIKAALFKKISPRFTRRPLEIRRVSFLEKLRSQQSLWIILGGNFILFIVLNSLMYINILPLINRLKILRHVFIH